MLVGLLAIVLFFPASFFASANQASPAVMTLLAARRPAVPAVVRVGADSVAFSPDGLLLAAAYGNGAVWLWDPSTDQRRSLGLAAGFHSAGADGVAFSPNGKLLAAAYTNGTIGLWNPANGQASGSLLWRGVGGANAVAFSPDGKLLAAGYGDGSVRLWNPDTGRSRGLAATGSFRASVNAVAFGAGGKLLAIGYGNGTIRLWDASTGQAANAPLQTGKASVNAVAFSPDGELLGRRRRRRGLAVGPGYRPTACHRQAGLVRLVCGRGERRRLQPGRETAGRRLRQQRHRAMEPGHRPSGRLAPPG